MIVKVPALPIAIAGVVDERVMGVVEDEVSEPEVSIEISAAKSDPVIELAKLSLE